MTGAEIVATGITHIAVTTFIIGGYITALILIFSFKRED